jgi:GWxTD domain-containing protein
MFKRCLFLIIIAFSFFPLLSQTEKRSAQELPPRFKKWIEEEVVYIITPIEREVFLKLETDRERDLFIEAFWNHRDPTEGTPENEFKKEHERRVGYANRILGRGVPKPGWKTDRGYMYILIGEPTSIERILGEAEIFNAEIWFYQGLAKYGLPAGFSLIFFQKGGAGDYVLYSPTNDGPQALLTSYFGDPINYLQAFNRLKKINPQLARFSLSLIPGESPQFGRPTLASEILIQNIGSVPQKQLKDKYAENFLRYKDIVEVEYSANYISNNSLVRVLKDASGLFFVHYIVEIRRFSLQSHQDKFVTNLKINGSILDMEGNTIHQFEGAIPFEFNQQQVKSITYSPFSFYDIFPIVPGTYRFSVLLKNEVSKEFTSIEETLSVPGDDSIFRMSPLILGYKVETADSAYLMPFKMGTDQIFSQPRNIFCKDDKMTLFFQILGLDESRKQKSEIRYNIAKEDEKILTLTRRVSEYADPLSIKEEFSLLDFQPGYYQVEVSFVDEGNEIYKENEHFEITPVSRIPRPWVYANKLSPASHPSMAFPIGKQYFNQGNYEKARIHLEKAYYSQPNSLNYSLSLALLYLKLNESSRAKSILLPFLESSEPNYNLCLLLGQALYNLNEFDRAVSVFNEAISHFGVNSQLLNSVGDCYHAWGKKEEALAAWKKSLDINPDQPPIKEKVASLEKNKKSAAL